MKILTLIVLFLIFASCAPLHANKTSFDSGNRLSYKEKAEAGDAEAQFQLGNSYCCGNQNFWDTKEAISWWCLAAQQGHAGAIEAVNRVGGECE